jgi:hypothetical protein
MQLIIYLNRFLLADRGFGKIRILNIIVLSGFLLGSSVFLAWADDASSLFDKPLHETHAPLPLDPYNPHSKPLLSCFYYTHFMVKQVDLGEKGAEQLSILPYFAKNHDSPCLRANAKDEMVIDSKTWNGYFKGVRGDFVFFVADDGTNGGLGFAVYNGPDGTKIFEDVAKLDHDTINFAAIAVWSDPEDQSETVLQLRYRRVYLAPCSLRADETRCLSRIQRIVGLTEASSAICSAAYEAEKKRTPEYASKVDFYSSVITYDVEVVLNRRNTAVRVAPSSKAMECYIAD